MLDRKTMDTDIQIIKIYIEYHFIYSSKVTIKTDQRQQKRAKKMTIIF